MNQALAAGNPQLAQHLVQLETSRAMRRMRKRGDGSGSSEEEEELRGAGHDLAALANYGGSGAGVARKMAGVRRMRRDFYLRPAKVATEFVDMIRGRLNVVDGGSWHMRQYATSLKASFGQHAGLWRIRAVLMEICHLGMIQCRPVHALALTARLSQAVHQAALAGGSWEAASLFLPFDDPAGPPRYAGSFEQVGAIAAHREALSTLRPPPPRHPHRQGAAGARATPRHRGPPRRADARSPRRRATGGRDEARGRRRRTTIDRGRLHGSYHPAHLAWLFEVAPAYDAPDRAAQDPQAPCR